MDKASKFLLLIAVALVSFGWWGLATDGGMRTFDEMAGLIPFFAGIAGAFCGIGGAILWFAGRRRGARG